MINQLKTMLLLGLLPAILIGFGGLLGSEYLYVFTALALTMNLGAYFFSDRVVLRLHGARETTPEQSPRLHDLVAELAHGAGIPTPRVFVVEDEHANAFATGCNPRRGAIALTTGFSTSSPSGSFEGCWRTSSLTSRTVTCCSRASRPRSPPRLPTWPTP